MNMKVQVNFEAIKQSARELLSRLFPTLPYYQEFLRDKMLFIIDSVKNLEDLCPENARMISERCFTSAALSLPKPGIPSEVMAEIEHGLQAVFVLLQYLWDERDPHSDFIHDSKTFLLRYPEFDNLCDGDLHFLLRFRNTMVAALKLLPTGQNKKALLDICAKLEGRDKPIKYHTGTGQTLHTARRVYSYLKEAKLQLTEQIRLLNTINEKPERRANSRKSKDLVIPRLNFDQISILRQFPISPESQLLSKRAVSFEERCLLSSEAENAMMTLVHLFRDVNDLPAFIGGSILQEISGRILKLKETNVFLHNLTAAQHVDEQHILGQYYRNLDFNASTPEAKDLEKLWNKLRAAVAVLKLLLLWDTPAARSIQYENEESFLSRYEDGEDKEKEEHILTYADFFGDDLCLVQQEVTHLFRFANAIRLMHASTSHRLEQTHMLRIGERLEGSHNRYTTGGGCSEATKRRQLILRRETGKALTVSNRTMKKRASNVVSSPEDESLVTGKYKRSTMNNNPRKRQCLNIETGLPIAFSDYKNAVSSCSSSSSIDRGDVDDDHELLGLDEFEETDDSRLAKMEVSVEDGVYYEQQQATTAPTSYPTFPAYPTEFIATYTQRSRCGGSSLPTGPKVALILPEENVEEMDRSQPIFSSTVETW